MEGTACTKAQKHELVGHLGKVCEPEVGLAEEWETGPESGGQGPWCRTKKCGLFPRGWEPQEFVSGGETHQAGLEGGSRRG